MNENVTYSNSERLSETNWVVVINFTANFDWANDWSQSNVKIVIFTTFDVNDNQELNSPLCM